MDDDKLDLIIKLCEADVSMKSRELVTDIMKSLTTSEVSQIRDMVKRKVADDFMISVTSSLDFIETSASQSLIIRSSLSSSMS
jgi:hypothetical protein